MYTACRDINQLQLILMPLGLRSSLPMMQDICIQLNQLNQLNHLQPG